jgi:hypothetical protein
MNDRPLTALVSDLFSRMGGLLRNEGELARVEIAEKANQLKSALIVAAIGVLLGLPAITIVLDGIAATLVRLGLDPDIAALIVGGVVLAISAILLWVAMRRLAAVSFVPTRTLNQLRRDVAVVNVVRQSHEQRAA